MERKTKKLLNYNVDVMTFSEATEYSAKKLENNEGMQVVTINPEMIELAEKNEEYAEILRNADLVVADGVGIKIAFKLKGINIEQVRGIEYSKELIKTCFEKGYNIALIGAKENVIEKAISNLKKEYDGLKIIYSHNGYFSEAEEEQIRNEIKCAAPQLILVALGAPKQEIFIKKCKENYPNGIYIGVGGSFDVWAGEIERAPKIYQDLGLEWLYRTISQPERFKRIYKTLPLFLIKAIIEAMTSKGK